MINASDFSVFEIFKMRGAAEIAVDQLIKEGFEGADVSLLMPNADETKQFALEHSTLEPYLASEGMLERLGARGALGPLIAAGPIIGFLVGLSGAKRVGSVEVTGALLSMGISDSEAKECESALKAGASLVAVHTHSFREAVIAERILHHAELNETLYAI